MTKIPIADDSSAESQIIRRARFSADHVIVLTFERPLHAS